MGQMQQQAPIGVGAAQVLSSIRGLGGVPKSKQSAHANPTLLVKPNYSGSLGGDLREKFFEGMHPYEKIQYLSLRKMTGFKTNFHLEDDSQMKYLQEQEEQRQQHQQQQQHHNKKSHQNARAKTLAAKKFRPLKQSAQYEEEY